MAQIGDKARMAVAKAMKVVEFTAGQAIITKVRGKGTSLCTSLCTPNLPSTIVSRTTASTQVHCFHGSMGLDVFPSTRPTIIAPALLN